MREVLSFVSFVFRDLAGNRLSGTIPRRIRDLTNLDSLDLSQNKFTGVLPIDIEALFNMKTFVLGQTQLEGPIRVPRSAPFLERFFVSMNRFTGTFPDMSSYSKLTAL